MLFDLGVQSNFDQVCLFNRHAVVKVFGSQCLVFGFNFFFELSDLMLRDLELAIQLSNVVLSL